MRSIQKQLTARLLIVALLLTSTAGSFLYLYARLRLTRQFDQELRTKANALSSMMLSEVDGRLEFDFSPQAMPEFSGGRHPSYFQIWKDGGEVVWRSGSLNGGNLLAAAPVPGDPFDLRLPNSKAGRAAIVRFIPRPDEADGPPPPTARHVPPLALTLVCAEDRRDVDHVLEVLGTSLLLTAVVVSTVVVLAVTLTVRRAMSPLRQLAAEVDAIGMRSLTYRFAAPDLPAELRPIAERLNELLDRLEKSFTRERRFTADVAHELRTPIAELRSTAQVAMKLPEQNANSPKSRDVLQIAAQMETLVNTLLTIARCEDGVQARLQPVDLSETLHGVRQPWQDGADHRRLRIEWDVAPGVRIRSDLNLLVPLLTNLLENAVAYTPAGGRIVCRLHPRDNEAELSISNTNDTLEPQDIRHLFEPFWRKDAAPTIGTHCGLGLSLVALYAVAIGASVRASLDGRQMFTVVTSFPLDTTQPSPRLPAVTANHHASYDP